MKYDVRDNNTSKIRKSFETLEEAIKYCDSKKTKTGHRVTRTENNTLITYYDTFKARAEFRVSRGKAAWGLH